MRAAGWRGPQLPGRLVENFEIQEKLGEGGMGVVYRALDRKLDRLVALKFLPPRLAESQENLERLVQEAKAISALNHPNIATIYGLEEEGAERFLVLEYLPGGTLKGKLQEAAASGRWLTIGQVVNYAIGSAEGLAHAHRRGIVHQDVKTSNLMLTEEGTVKITDFGLARLAKSRDKSKPGTVMGTAAYMAPEQALGGEADARSDIFSFGVALFELATGRLPFESSGDVAALSENIHQPTPRLRGQRPDAPEALERVVSRALEKRREDRYQSMDELLADLYAVREALEGDAGAPTREMPKLSLPKPTARRRWLVAAGLAAAAMVLLPAVTPRARRVFSGWFQPTPASGEKLVAVLPFRNLGQPGDDALCAGLMEILTNKLTQLEKFQGAMRVVSASDVLSQRVNSPREAGSAFGAALALTGGVQRDGDILIVAINLVDTRTQAQLAAHTIEHRLESLAVLQNLLLENVADMLTFELKPEARQTLSAGLSAVPAAYSFYVTGRGYLQRHDRAENVDNAIAMFQQAVEQDPKYALAYAGMAEAYWRKHAITKDPGLLDLAKAHGVRAIRQNDQLAPVHVTIGLIQISSNQYPDAVRSFQKALELDPLNVDAHRGLARAYEGSGRLKEAEAIYQRAIQLRPGSWDSHRDLGRFYFYHDRYNEAEPRFKRVIELTPDNYQAYSNLGATYLKLGRNEDAAAMLERSLAIKPGAYAHSGLGTVYYFQGRYLDAAAQYEKAISFTPKDPLLWGNLADAYRWAPAPGESLKAFRTAIELAESALAANPKNAKLRSALATYRSSTGDRTRALKDIAEALRLDPLDSYVLFRAALVYEQSGLRDRALNALEACLKAGYSTQEIRRARPLRDLRQDSRYQELEAAQSK